MKQMNELLKIASPRDKIFQSILDTYNNNSVGIFQIGAIETLDNELFRIGSGWSDIIFGKYIKSNGGTLTISDISLDHLANSCLMSKYIGYNVNLCHGDAINYIDDSYDIYYLDGSNDPRETLDQLNKVISFNKKCHIIVDDFSIKGAMININKFPFTIHRIEKGLGVLYNG